MIGNLFGILAVLCAIWVIYDVLTTYKKWTNEKKLIWIVCAVLFSIVTAVVYYLLVKRK